MGLLDIINESYDIIEKILLPLSFSLCFLYFFWGIAKYIRTGAGSDKEQGEGRRIMVWGIVAIFVLVSFWGIVRLIKEEFNLPDTNVNFTNSDVKFF